MTGNNTVLLCEPEMIVALQHYWDTVIFAAGHSPKIVSIKPAEEKTSGYNSASKGFEVKTTSPESDVKCKSVESK